MRRSGPCTTLVELRLLRSRLPRCIKRLGRRSIDPRHPQRAAQVVGAWAGSGHLEPTQVFLVGLIRLHPDVALAPLAPGLGAGNLMEPAMLAASPLRLH